MATWEAAIAAHRFGMGAAPGELEAWGFDAPRRLFSQTLHPETALADWESPFSSSLVAMRRMVELRGETDEDRMMDGLERIRQQAAEALPDAIEHIMWRAVESPTPFLERLVWFWSNHFAISVADPTVTPFAAAFEREAIRPHILGPFEDMLIAVERHPAMLSYLDNAISVGPNSYYGLRGEGGINENLAREILELHTLGVDGGYDQADVEALARIITGWSVPAVAWYESGEPAQPFIFLPGAHEPGPKILLGRTYQEDGQREGMTALTDLARHPATARHLATKLARHFVADDPPAELVDALARAYLARDGDLGDMTRALIEHPLSWSQERGKLRTPAELIAAGVRAMALERSGERLLVRSLAMLDHMPFHAPSPAGYDDRAAAWAGPEAIMSRIEWCGQAAGRSRLDVAPDVLAADVMGPFAGEDTLETCRMAPSRWQGYAVLLASPDFQWR